MESYRFAISGPIEDFRRNDSIYPPEVAPQEIVELIVGDEFCLPGMTSIWYTVLDMELETNSMIYSPCGSENQVEFRMNLTEFSREYMNGGAINREDRNVYLRPMGHTIPANTPSGNVPAPEPVLTPNGPGGYDFGPAYDPVLYRTVNIADEEHYWNPAPEDAPAPTWPDPLPLEEGSFIQGAARTLRAANDLQNQLQEYRNVIGGPVTVGTTARPDLGELRFIAAENNPLQQLEDYIRENFGGPQEPAEEKEPVELSKEVWCF